MTFLSNVNMHYKPEMIKIGNEIPGMGFINEIISWFIK